MSTFQVLLDKQTDEILGTSLRHALENASSDRICGLHVWSIGHGINAAEIAVISDDPRSPEYYKSLIPDRLNIVHATVEIHKCPSH